jgi:hypothetical protein
MLTVQTKVKIKIDDFTSQFEESWFNLKEITDISSYNDKTGTYMYKVQGLWFMEGDLIVFTKEEYPELYV